MANWKKVVVSGSSAQLSSLTLDTFLESGSGGTGLTSTSLLAAATGTVLTKGAFGLGLTALPEPIEIPAGTVSSSAQTIANLSGTGIISGSVQVVGSTFTSGETITQFSSSAATRISTLENASSTAPAGTISSSATGTAQGTIALNGVDVNIKDMQAASSPTFAEIELGNATDTTITRVSGGVIAVEGNTVLMASGGGIVSGSSQIQDASLTQKGIVELATTAEVTTGTDATRAVTPDSLKDGYQGSANVVTLGTVTNGDVSAILPSGTVSGSVQVVGSTFTSGETITQFSSSAATRISTLENASSTAPAGTISSSATGTAQGTIALNGVDVNIKDMQAASSPTFVGLTLTTGDAIFGGNLTVQGTASFENTENLQIKDRFISLASGSAGPSDGGIVIEQTNANGGKGAVFAYDGLSTGRWGIDTAFNPTASTYTPAAFMSAVVEGGSGVDTPSAVGSDYVKKGNIFVGANQDIYIYS